MGNFAGRGRAPSFDAVAGNGLINRCALLGRGIAIAGAAGAVGTVTSAAAEPLTDDEVYALTAYILSLNKQIGDNDRLDAKTLPQVKMPNRDNFSLPYPDRV